MTKYVCRFGIMRTIGVFSAKQNETYRRGNRVVLRTNRGLETGEVLVEATEHVLSQMEDPIFGNLVRQMTIEDEQDIQEISDKQAGRMADCRRLISEQNLDMKLVDIEQLFGGEKIVVYYIADERVDFRELVKQLAGEFRSKIEMRQIGVRDEAKLLADYGDCGKPVCCNTHLSRMPPVSMRMAKVQRVTFDPNKISGRCGRLKCCLRYEFDTYQSLQSDMPPLGSVVDTTEGEGKIINIETLTNQLLVLMEDKRRVMVDATDVVSVIKKGPGIV